MLNRSESEPGDREARFTIAEVVPVGNARLLSDGQVDLAHFLSTLRRRWKMVATPMVLGICGVSVYFALAEEMYTAAAQILIDIQKPQIIGDAVVPGLDTSRYMIGPVIDSQVEIIRSNHIARRVSRATDLPQDPDYASDRGSFLDRVRTVLNAISTTGNAAPSTAAPADVPPRVIDRFRERLDVRRKDMTLILLVRYSDEDPVRAAEIANTTVDTYLAEQRESRIEATNLANEELTERVEDLREQVIAAERRIQEYSAANDLVSVGGQTVSEREVSEAVTQLVNARADLALKRAKLQQVEALSADPDAATSISGVLESQVIRELRRQESEVTRQLASIVNQFGERDTRAQGARAELRDLRQEIVREVKRYIQNARNDYEIAKTQIRFLQDNLEQMTQRYAERNILSLRQSEMEREAKATRDLYLSLLSRLKETQIQAGLLYPDARVIDRAIVPRRASSPRKLIILALVLLGTLGLGITLAVLREHLAPTARRPETTGQD